MKKISNLLAACFITITGAAAQNVGIGTTTPNASAALEISANNRGILVPRTSSGSRIAIVNPAKGLLVYDSTTASFWYYNASVWKEITNGSSGWSLTGNNGTNPANNFIGTTDNQLLIFKVNNKAAGAIDEAGANAFFGPGSGRGNSIGTENVGLGSGTLFSNSIGSRNVAIGDSALYSLYGLTGNSNTAVGTHTLFSTINSIANTAIGGFSMVNVEDGGYNTAVGLNTLTNNISGDSNTAVGTRALQFNTSSRNTAIGTSALRFNSTANENTALGFEAAYSNTNGQSNTAIGTYALRNSNGSANVAVGHYAAIGNTSGGNNIAIGYYALRDNTTGSNNIAIGSDGPLPPGTVSNTISLGNYDYVPLGSNQVFIGSKSMVFIGGQVNWTIYSDKRIKKDITEDVGGIDFIRRLRPVTYYRNAKMFDDATGQKDKQPDYTGKYDFEKIKYSGFLAQEVEKAANDSHYDFSGIHKPKNKHDLYSLSYAEFVVPLVKAMQEQQVIIESQSKKIAELEKLDDRIKAMQVEMDSLKALLVKKAQGLSN